MRSRPSRGFYVYSRSRAFHVKKSGRSMEYLVDIDDGFGSRQPGLAHLQSRLYITVFQVETALNLRKRVFSRNSSCAHERISAAGCNSQRRTVNNVIEVW